MSYGTNTVVLRSLLTERLRDLQASAKEIALCCGVSARTVEGWRAGDGISAAALIALCRRYPSIWQDVCALVDRTAMLARLEALDAEARELRKRYEAGL